MNDLYPLKDITVDDPPLRYHGSKWRAAPWVIAAMPECELYVEAFGGGASVLLRRKRAIIEVYNDLDREVVNFFQVLRERPHALIRAIALTPFAHAEQKMSMEPTNDPVEAARRFYVRSHLTISGPTAQWNSGWRRQTKVSKRENGKGAMSPAAKTFMRTENLWQVAERLRGVCIEEMDALDLIRRYDRPETLFYVDPPYVHSTRVRMTNHAYAYEMTDDQHRELAAVLHGCRGMIVLSGYNCELYEDLFGDWQRIDRDFRTNGNAGRLATESIWLNPATVDALARQEAERRAAECAHLPLFRTNGNGVTTHEQDD